MDSRTMTSRDIITLPRVTKYTRLLGAIFSDVRKRHAHKKYICFAMEILLESIEKTALFRQKNKSNVYLRQK